MREQSLSYGIAAPHPVETDGSGALENLFARVPSEIRASFTPRQCAALREALAARTWNGQPVDVRLNLPLPLGRCFVALVAGRERRTRKRPHFGWSRPKTLAAFIGIAVSFYVLVLIGILSYSAIIDF